jgi:fructose/tagatose bisphosphate aldolase
VRSPLVLHGGNGIAREDTDVAIQEGVVKINIGASIFEAWTNGLREGLDPAVSDEDGHDPLPPEGSAAALLEAGVRRFVAIKNGENGAYLKPAAEKERGVAPHQVKAADGTGAGDAFFAGILAA